MVAILNPAAAQPVDTTTCVEGLSDNARLVYDAIAPQLPPAEGTAEELIRATVREMVMSGHLSRRHARPAVDEAEPCLRLLRGQ
jgi:hypothetical protein